ncbi:MAG: hypothetical protein QXK06_01935 [Candidatus Diapherotrites archaeon]
MNFSFAEAKAFLFTTKGKRKLKPLSIAVIAVCIALAIFLTALILFKSPTETLPRIETPTPTSKEKAFLEKYSDLAQAWKANGVSAERLHEAFSELEKKNALELRQIIESLEKQKTVKDEKIALLASAYLEIVEFAIAKKEHETMLAKAKTLHEKPTCETFMEYEKLLLAAKKMTATAKAFYEKTKQFIEKFPAEAETISLKSEEFPWKNAEEEIALLENSIKYFKEKC